MSQRAFSAIYNNFTFISSEVIYKLNRYRNYVIKCNISINGGKTKTEVKIKNNYPRKECPNRYNKKLMSRKRRIYI